jgi:hypothetical protein
MRTPGPDETAVLKVEHIVRATHASTGQPIAPLDAGWKDPPPPGKLISILGGTVVVSMDQRLLPVKPIGGYAQLPKLTLRVLVPDGPVARLLADLDKELVVAQIVESGEVDHAVEFEPIPMTLTVDLVRTGAGPNGGPSTGKTVEARASNGTREPLPEVAGEPGTYRSAARVWTAGFNPLDLLVGNTLVRRISIDFSRTDTRVTVVDPT